MKTFRRWLYRKWVELSTPEVMSAYHRFSISHDGQLILQHLMDNVYCTVYTGTDPNEALAHNARRSVVHDILVNIDAGEHPDKYKVKVVQQEIFNGA